MDEFSSQSKEVFALYGLAYYESEVLHRGLCNFYTMATFDKPESVTRARAEEKLSYAFSLTLGQLINELKVYLPDDVQNELDLALEKRNYLAHHFWYERNYLMFDEEGLSQLQNELLGYSEFFDGLDKQIQSLLRPISLRFGITDEFIEENLESMLMGEKDEPLLNQRKLNKRERIIRVWDARVEDGAITQIFQSDDGVLWQLSDVGLGWTRFKSPEDGWQENQKIQKYLPAVINPRPDISESWSYDLVLKKGCVLQIRPGGKPKTYRFHILEET